MNFLAFSKLSAAWLFLLFIPLVIFYFLKLKRPRMDISSLALWRQVMNDQRVNSPFQKFKRNLLLLLQSLILAGIVLAAMQPFILRTSERSEFLPIIIDCSASMGAHSETGRRTPLDEAKDRVRALIDGLVGKQQISLIAAHSSARRLTDFTDNARVLHDALDRIKPTDLPSNIEDALRMTEALARSYNIPSVILLSDGNLPVNVDVELPFELNFQKLTPGGANVGITELDARRSGPTRWDVFARLETSETESAGGTLELLQDGKTVAKATVFLQPGDSQRASFRVDAEAKSSLELRFTPDGFDSLDADNAAYLELPRSRPVSAFVSEDLTSYRHALEVLKGVDVHSGQAGERSTGGYDLIISDQPADDMPDAAVSLFVGVVPPELKDVVDVETGFADVIDWQRASELLQHVQLNDVLISDQPRSRESVADQTYEQLGFEIMAHASTGPLILKKRTGTRLAYYTLFHTDRSTLPYRVGFPILVSNLVQIARQQASLSEVRGARTGVLPEIALLPDRDYRIIAPDGSERVVRSDVNAIVSGIGADYVGRYDVRDGGRLAKRIGASLLSSLETTLRSVDKLQFNELPVAAAPAPVQSDYPLWRWFALFAFCVVVGEWWCFQRRPGGFSR